MKPPLLTPEIHDRLQHVTASAGTSLARFPDFLIAGPQRTGTTWLFRHLDVHPEIFLPHGKETYYFSTLGQPEARHHRFETLDAYLAFMRDRPWRWLRKSTRCLALTRRPYRPRLIGDATASYAILPPEVIREIVALNPAIRVVLILRDPIDRAWSHAKKDLLDRHGKAPEDVPLGEYAKFFRARGQRDKNRYSTIIDNWRAELAEGHLLAAEFRLIREDPRTLMHQLLAFLGTREGEAILPAGRFRRQINPTRTQVRPDAVTDWLRGEYADLTRDYGETLERLQAKKIADGCYLM